MIKIICKFLRLDLCIKMEVKYWTSVRNKNLVFILPNIAAGCGPHCSHSGQPRIISDIACAAFVQILHKSTCF